MKPKKTRRNEIWYVRGKEVNPFLVRLGCLPSAVTTLILTNGGVRSGVGVIGTAWVVHQFSPSLLGLFPTCNIWFSTFSTTEILAHLEESL